MSSPGDGWRETLTALGQSLIEVLRAELAVIGEAWKRSGRELGIALGLFAAAAYVGLICLPALLILALVAGLDIWLPLWGAALVAAALVAVIVYLLVMLAMNRLHKRCENPVTAVKHRFADHIAWWNERVLQVEATNSSPSGGTSHSSPSGGTSHSSPSGGTSHSSPSGGTSHSSPSGGTSGESDEAIVAPEGRKPDVASDS